jgi:hypothetical protein
MDAATGITTAWGPEVRMRAMFTIRIVRIRQTATTRPQTMATFRLVRRAARRARRSATLDPASGSCPTGSTPASGSERPGVLRSGSVGYGSLVRLGYPDLVCVGRTLICP